MWRGVAGQDFENRPPGTALSSSEYSTFFSALRPSWKASVTCEIRRSHGCNDPQLLRLDQFENHGVLPKGPICTDLPGSPRFSSFCQFAQFRCSNHLYYAMELESGCQRATGIWRTRASPVDVRSELTGRLANRPIYPESGPVYPEPPQNVRSLEPQYSSPPQTPLLAEPQNPRSWEPEYPNPAPPQNPPSGVSQGRLEPQMMRPPEGGQHPLSLGPWFPGHVKKTNKKKVMLHLNRSPTSFSEEDRAQRPSEGLEDQVPGPTETPPLPASPRSPPTPPPYFPQEGSMPLDGKEDTLKGRLWGMSAVEMLHILCAELLFGSCLQSTTARVWMEHEDHRQSFGELVCDSLGRQHQDSCPLCAFCSLKMEQCHASGNVNRVKCADGLNHTSYLNPKIQAEHENIGNQICDSDDFMHPHYCSFKSYQCRRYSIENILVARMTCENDKSYKVLNMERGEEEVLLWSQKFLSYTQG
ncbi:UNVERIFIED_CONTAM: hypothetical protein FKN15_060680 [Acipenser sinensis]